MTVFETGDATPEQVAADAERCREEERQRLVNQQAKKVRFRTLFPPLSVLTPIGDNLIKPLSAGAPSSTSR